MDIITELQTLSQFFLMFYALAFNKSWKHSIVFQFTNLFVMFILLYNQFLISAIMSLIFKNSDL